jgi:hypothetical protein
MPETLDEKIARETQEIVAFVAAVCGFSQLITQIAPDTSGGFRNR